MLGEAGMKKVQGAGGMGGEQDNKPRRDSGVSPVP